MAGSPEDLSYERSQRLLAAIAYRQAELHRVADVLAANARRLRLIGASARVILITLGAVTSAQASFAQLLTGVEGASNIVFVLLGLAVSVIAGIETAFRFERRGSELNMLAAQCHSLLRHCDSVWHRMVLVEADEARRQQGALDLIDLQDAKLEEVQGKAAAAGVDIAWCVRDSEPPREEVISENLVRSTLPTDPRTTYAA